MNVSACSSTEDSLLRAYPKSWRFALTLVAKVSFSCLVTGEKGIVSGGGGGWYLLLLIGIVIVTMSWSDTPGMFVVQGARGMVPRIKSITSLPWVGS